MQENRGAGPNFELPPRPPSAEDEARQEQSAEAPPARPERAANQPKQPALPAVPDDIPVADQPVIAAPPQDIAGPTAADPKAIAHDSDHIEREWVDKVRRIVALTQDDPHLQKQEMSKVKAEYIQKRFNKTIKTDEATA